MSKICFLKLYRFKFCSKNYFRKFFQGLCNSLQHYLCMRGNTTVSACHHSEVQSWISQAVTRLIKFYQNQASWYLSLHKVFCKVTCLLLYEHPFRRRRAPTDFQENTAKTRSVHKLAYQIWGQNLLEGWLRVRLVRLLDFMTELQSTNRNKALIINA